MWQRGFRFSIKGLRMQNSSLLDNNYFAEGRIISLHKQVLGWLRILLLLGLANGSGRADFGQVGGG